MSELDEEGPDANNVRRHAKKMFSEREYRMRYRRLDFYRPNEKQKEFHNLIANERMLRAGNQQGKTHAAAAQIAMDACALYPEDWYKGRKFIDKPPIERPFDFLSWAASPTSVTTRDGAQTKLLGDLTSEGGLGTGLIPLDNILGKPAMARGIADFVDTVTLRRETGGRALHRFKTYEMDRKAYQGEAVDELWFDEDPGDDIVYGEGLARLTTTRGQIICTMTPTLGLSPIRKRYKAGIAGCREILMTIHDAARGKGGHIADEDIAMILARYKESERATRGFGADMQGEGAVFEIPLDQIKWTGDPTMFPPYYRWLWGVDFRHSGNASSGHPFAAVLAVHTGSDGDVIHIVDGFRMHGMAPMHVARMKEHPLWRAPVAYPHDGGRGASLISGETVAALYKKLGLYMRPTHATFPDGGFNFEAGIAEMENRFGTKRLLISAHLHEIFDEYQGYHRVNGQVHKIDDDLMSAIRQVCMDIRFAQSVTKFNVTERFSREPGTRFARGSPNHPDGDIDVFTGR